MTVNRCYTNGQFGEVMLYRGKAVFAASPCRAVREDGGVAWYTREERVYIYPDG